MTTTLDYRCNVLATKQYGRRRDDTSAHLGMLSLWAVVGLALAGLAFALGIDTEMVGALAAAG